MAESNQIWAPYLVMLQQEGKLEKLHYRVKNNRVSPYLELQADSLYGNGTYEDGAVCCRGCADIPSGTG